MKLLVFISAFVALLSCAFALNVLAPVSAQVEHGSSINIGNVGPGQTFSIVVEPKVAALFLAGITLARLLAVDVPSCTWVMPSPPSTA